VFVSWQALHVNPHSAEEIAMTLACCMRLADEEKESRMLPLTERQRELTSDLAVRLFIDAMEDVVSSDPEQASGEIEFERALAPLDLESRPPFILFLDYDGTLAEIAQTPDQATIQPSVRVSIFFSIFLCCITESRV
jgi:hypothetical protein